jgi:heptaprenyl diphosphate synthase
VTVPVVEPRSLSGSFLALQDPEVARALEVGLEQVEAALRDAVRHADGYIDAASSHLVAAGGKRLRPMLTLLAGQLGPDAGTRGPVAASDDVVKAAVVVELTHLASLYHDDVMDEALMRRGVPSGNARYGNTVAILTGDLLFARASLVVADLGTEAVRIQAATFERLCTGQVHETVGPSPQDDPVEHYLSVLADKTASLIATAGCSAPASAAVTRRRSRCCAASASGLASPSSLPTTCSTCRRPHRVGQDARHRPTRGHPHAARAARAPVDRPGGRPSARAARRRPDDDALHARPSSCCGRTRPRAGTDADPPLGDDARAALAPLPESSVKDALTALAQGVVDRSM